MTRKAANTQSLQLNVFDTELGWVAIWGQSQSLHGVVFGLRSAAAATSAAKSRVGAALSVADWHPDLTERFKAYAAGAPDDFGDVEIDLAHLTTFAARVVRHCRRVAYGQTISYGR